MVTSRWIPVQSNILISDSQPPRALLGDFGFNKAISGSHFPEIAPINWTAPEPFTPDSTLYQTSVANDVYALAMGIYEICIGSPLVSIGSD